MKMKAFILITGLLSLPSSLTGHQHKNSSASPNVSSRTFHGIQQGIYECFPLPDMEDSTTSTLREYKCSSGKSNDSTLKVNNTTIQYLNSSLSTKLIPAVYLTVVLLGIPSNTITLWMLFFRIRSVCTAIFYTNLAISDLLFCIMLPFKIAYHFNGNNWIFGEVMCRTMTAIFYGNMYCSILLLSCISISRYVAIIHPFTYRSLPKRTYAILVCCTVWAIVFLYMLPFYITKQSYCLEQLNICTCHDVQNAMESLSFRFYYFICLAFFGFVIPLTITVFCYIAIIQTLNIYEQKWLWYVKISLLTLTIFAICFIPSNIILIVHHVNYYYNKRDDLYFFYLIALCLSSLNSCLDPFLYFLMSKVKDQSNIYLTMVKISREE
ncbi:proteinase-activated receptor 3 [Alligator sinensis]|uniref:Proteinase-activated receptor 3 n=1 Tax=Alligator sinensis TaxID=38654 RepID=A0A1U7SAI2_ALLSI|nr:proteinase-activated receptor 3 [Alligator sinensis]